MLSKMDGSRGHVAELEPTADLVIDTVSLKIKRTTPLFSLLYPYYLPRAGSYLPT